MKKGLTLIIIMLLLLLVSCNCSCQDEPDAVTEVPFDGTYECIVDVSEALQIDYIYIISGTTYTYMKSYYTILENGKELINRDTTRGTYIFSDHYQIITFYDADNKQADEVSYIITFEIAGDTIKCFQLNNTDENLVFYRK